MSAEVLTITPSRLEDALLWWEREHRAGETRTAEETAAMPPEQVARENAQHLWVRLGGSPLPPA